MFRRLGSIAVVYGLVGPSVAQAAPRRTAPPAAPRYQAVADEPYLQEVGSQVRTERPVTSVAVVRDEVLATMGGALHRLVADGRLEPLPGGPNGLQRVEACGGRLWGVADDGLYLWDDLAAPPQKVLAEQVVSLCVHLDAAHAATQDRIYRFDGKRFVDIEPDQGWRTTDTTLIQEDGSQVLMHPVRIGPIERIASYSGTLYLLRPRGLAVLDGETFVEEPVDWGALPSPVHRDLLVHGSRLVVATDRGLGVLRGAALTAVRGTDGLPYEDVTCLADGFDGDLWIGTSTGAVRQTGDQYHYFGAQHWLPGEPVYDIAAADRTVYVATERGLGVIRYEPYTLAKKARYFEDNLELWGHKRLGFVHKLYWQGSPTEGRWLREISDNDGGHTAHYLAAMAFKYAVTGDEADRREAVDAAEAMIWLRTITGDSGFFARSVWAVGVDEGERATQGSGGLPAKWQASADGKWLWKGDTSSDEVNAHFYAVALYHDLVAKGAERERAAEHLARIARHIVDNGWVLRDVDGQPTRWGRWDPQYLLAPYGFESRGLNGLEAQSYMWTALGLTGDEAFRQAFAQLVDWGYPKYTVRQKITFPPENVVPWDDELAFRALHPVLVYCDDPRYRSIYLRALERHWEVMRMQKVAFFNFVYGGLTGNDCEAEQAVQGLREWSLDTVSHDFRNSHRADLAPQPGYVPYMGGTRALSPREREAQWESRSALEYDGGEGSRGATPPVGWLEDYWMGRYYGMIAAPTTDDLALLAPQVQPRGGAAPYAGPPRPALAR